MSVSIDTSRIQFKPVTVTYLEMQEPQPMPALRPGAFFHRWPKPIAVADYRSCYFGVGEKHQWIDRMVMPDEELEEKINAAHIDIWLFEWEGQRAGFAEFILDKAFTEILYFGLLPEFIGRGLGKYFLQWAIAKAWEYGAPVVQLNTCTLDHPHALPNYVAAGFRIIRTDTQQRRFIP